LQAGELTKPEPRQLKGDSNQVGPSQKDNKIIYFSVSVSRLQRATGKATLDMLVEGFKVFGVHLQYWMVVAAAIVALAIVIGLRRS
jgi:hypothetical protein